MGKLEGRVAVVTGGGRGIGRAVAELFAAEGAKIVIASLSPEPAAEVAAGIRSRGGEAMSVVTDVCDRESCRAAIKATVDQYGALDILVHNAAHIPIGSIETLSDEDLDKTFRGGVQAAFWLTKDALPYLEKSESPRILVTSSIAGISHTPPGLAHYAAVKAGINGFVRGVGLELARRGITVNGVAPGTTLGHKIQQMATTEQIARMTADNPIPRPAEPIEQAHGFLYLASDEARYVTGHVLVIDGGTLLGKIAPLFE